MTKSLLGRLRSTLTPTEREAVSAYRSRIARKEAFRRRKEELRQEREFQIGAGMVSNPRLDGDVYETILKNYGLGSSVNRANSKLVTVMGMAAARVEENIVPTTFYSTLILRITLFNKFLAASDLPDPIKERTMELFLIGMFTPKEVKARRVDDETVGLQQLIRKSFAALPVQKK